jgi:hypothetical protein
MVRPRASVKTSRTRGGSGGSGAGAPGATSCAAVAAAPADAGPGSAIGTAILGLPRSQAALAFAPPRAGLRVQAHAHTVSTQVVRLAQAKQLRGGVARTRKPSEVNRALRGVSFGFKSRQQWPWAPLCGRSMDSGALALGGGARRCSKACLGARLLARAVAWCGCGGPERSGAGRSRRHAVCAEWCGKQAQQAERARGAAPSVSKSAWRKRICGAGWQRALLATTAQSPQWQPPAPPGRAAS